MTTAERSAIINDNGKLDVDISKISSCASASMSTCEKVCSRYYSCQTIAFANDLLVEYENEKVSHSKVKYMLDETNNIC